MDMFHYQLITWLNKKIGRRKVAFLYMSDTWEIMTNQKKNDYTIMVTSNLFAHQCQIQKYNSKETG